jgi:actin-like protein 6A
MYCGDDVSSAVIDIGKEETRAGYSGEDCPRCVIPSYLGLTEVATSKPKPQSAANEDVDMEEEQKGLDMQTKYITGMTEISRKRENTQIKPLYQEDESMDFELLE